MGAIFNTIAFDPGGTTGWCVMSVYEDCLYDRQVRILDSVVFWGCGQYTGPRPAQVNEMAELVTAWAPTYVNARPGDVAPLDSLAVVTEDFTLRQFRMDRMLLEPERVNCGLEQLLWNMVPRRFAFRQQPSLALTTMTDERLLAAEAHAAEVAGMAGAKGIGGVPLGYHTATRGRPHARDALRHVFTFLQRERTARLESARRGDAPEAGSLLRGRLAGEA